MANVFQINTSDLKKLLAKYRLNEKEFKAAEVNVLNSQAFGTRLEAIKVINRRMIVRSPRFVETSLRVQKATLATKTSIVGSIFRKSFTGWIEQETGRKAERNRIPTVAARKENIRNKILLSNRFRAQNIFLSDKELLGPSASRKQRVTAIFSYVKRKKYNRPFLISGNTQYKKGLYRRIRQKTKLIQHVGDIDKTVKRLTWMGMAKGGYFRNNPQKRVWKNSIKRIVKFRK